MPLRTFWLDFNLAFRNIARQRRRSAIAVGAVGFGITALILANGFIEWIFLDFRESTIKSQLGHLQIVRPGYHGAGKADPYAFLLPDVIPELETPNEPRQIKAVAPRLSFSGLVSYGESTISFIGDGDDPRQQEAFGDALQISEGRNLAADDLLGIIVGEGLARNLGANVGDRVVLLASTASRGINAVEVTIRGLFSTVTKSYDDSALRMPIETARQLLRTQGSHVGIVLLNDTAQTDIVLAELREKLQKDNFEIVPWYDLADFYNKTVALYTRQINGVRLIIAVIILLSISNTMMMSVMERIGEIGTYMALGARRTGVMRRFLSEGVLLGCLGGLLGLLLGLILAYAISSVGIPMPPPPGMARGYTGQILVTWDIALKSLTLAVGTTLAASVYPAWRASRMQIVDALRHNR
ncbi:putative ABC transport system permease protein [Nitrosovibrio tenuis]|uniref:Putative ABC transport system permease protein n=1 Tax=Nitrosovibrio tenuis TaxID=1233 RepID=A0A1H7PP94_9PROT|nr:putative ABC transport system permease protein [Nitrosovibrio tenuis]